MNAITGEDLKDIFTTETWRDHFTTLSDGLGFSLSIYSQTGKPIFSPPGILPLCRAFRDSSPELQSRCQSSCFLIMMKTLQTGRPDIFKCYAGITSFALPIVYLNERAVILGQGSFSSYEDFRTCMDLVNSAGLEMFSIPTPLTFTSFQHAWKVCGIVADFVHRLIKNSRETAVLREKFESLKSVFSLWSTAANEPPETRYQGMLYNLSTLLDLACITIFTLDRQRSRYIGLYGLSKGGVRTEAQSIRGQDSIVQELQSGKPFVRSTVSADGSGADVQPEKVLQIFFPIMINNTVEGILSIADRDLHDNDRQIVSGFCKQTALFIENHRLHQHLHEKIDRLAAVSELTKTITFIQNYETLLRAILDKSAELLNAEQGSLMLLDHETDGLLLQAKKGIVDGVTEKLRINRGEGIAGKVAEFGEAMLVTNVEHDPRTRQKNRYHYKTSSFISVPLKIEDRVIGVLNLSDKITGEVFDEEDLKLIESFATHAAIVMERNVFYKKTEELKRLTITDSLTGLLNRRYLYERLKDEVARLERHEHQLSLLMLDLDGFKYCNDTFGHSFGDKTLMAVAETLLNTVRSMDVVARVGGDEFMIILPETSEQTAVDIAERVRSTIAKQAMFPDDAIPREPRSLTASIGIVCYPKNGKTLEHLLENVDKALYRAKNKGKNLTEVFHNMPFRTLQDKDFIGRQQELTALYKRVCEADTGTAQSLVLSGARGIGKTELLKQLFGLLFWKQDRIAPFYFTGNPALLSASTFSKNYLVRFLCQRLAFENKEQALFSCEGISLSALSALAEDRDAGWAKELIDQYQRNADDPVSALRIAFGAPHQSALMSGTPVAVLIDEFHRLKGLSLEGLVDPQLVSLMEGPMACAKTPYVITGNSAELLEMPVASCLENIVLAPLEGADAASRATTLLHANEVEGQVPPLLLRRLGGNPFYLSCVCKTVSEKKKPEDKDFWNAYTKEILQGTLARFWSSVLKGSFPDLSVRSIALAISHKIYRTKEPLSCRRIASSFALTDSQAEMIAHVLYRAGIIRGEFGVFRPLEDNVLRDIIDCLYRKEMLAASSHDLERECMEKLLPEKAEAVRFDLVLPMTKDAELVAAQCLEQVGKNLRLNQDTIGQLQIAVIEACINAMEHSRGTERKIYVGLAADEQRLEVSIESSGQEFIVKETGEPFGDQEATRPPGRGWGIKLMKRFADDVRFEKTSRGIKTVLIKNLDSSMRVQKEATNNE